ncbi:MAG: F0F1 ATP synthase subunit epsilon [Planctomycetota bacterium]
MAEETSSPVVGALRVLVVTPEGRAFEGLAAGVVVPGWDGEVAFLPGHAAYVGAVGEGLLRVLPLEGDEGRWYLEGGVVQVLDGEVTVLAERVTPTGDLDLEAAARDLEAALAVVPSTDEAFAERDRAVRSARARLRVGRS